MSGEDRPLRIALLVYRGKPTCGGQGVYTRHLAKGFADLGHHVEVLSGPPYPVLDERVPLVQIPSLDLFRDPDPFRTPKLSEFHDWVDVLEYALTCTAAFAEPLTFTLRAARYLRNRKDDFDIVLDNQSLGYGLLQMQRMGMPVAGIIHHPITVDREIEIEKAETWRKKLSLRRFYSFTPMQCRVAQRLPRVVTVSENSHKDIVSGYGVDPSVLRVVNVGVDPEVFHPRADVARVPGRLMTTASADVAMKGLKFLLEALAKLRTERDDAHLVVIGKPNVGGPVAATIERLGLGPYVEFIKGVPDERIVELYAEAELAVVPSLYEGFSLPAIEAMACGVPLVATTGGALPEVVGNDGETAYLVAPGDSEALVAGLRRALGDPNRAAVGEAGKARVLGKYTWQMAAAKTIEVLWDVLGEHKNGRP